MPDTPTSVQWWLAELDRYGNPRLCDGAHSERAGAEQALYLYHRLGLLQGKRYAAVRVEVYDIEPVPHGANEEAIETLNVVKRPEK